MTYTSTIRRWIGDDIDMFRCSPCGTFLNLPSKVAREHPPKDAAQAGKFMIERLARIPVEVDYASEWRYRDPIVPGDTITLVISQSGETADTIAAQREAKAKGSKTLAICNVVGSMITREAAGTIYTHAGPEIGVASTKAFTAQVTVLAMLALSLGRIRRHLSRIHGTRIIRELRAVPEALRSGALRRILETWEPPASTIYAVYPDSRLMSMKVRAFVDHLARTFGRTPYWDAGL